MVHPSLAQVQVTEVHLWAVPVFAQLLFALVGLAIAIVLLYLVYSCFDRIPPRYRQMEPWQVWLLLIPVFNLVWNFFVFPKLSRSFCAYFREQGRTDVGDCGEKIGLWLSICFAANIVVCIAWIAGPAALVLLIIYLVKAWGYRNQIPAGTV